MVPLFLPGTIMKKVLGIYGSSNRRWVGDGFQVRSLLSHNILGRHISPFFCWTTLGLLSLRPPVSVEGAASIRVEGGGSHDCL